ncbi:MAG: hypothetical protein AAGL98_04775, partial [Planctomycetota bacterium]
LALLLAALCGSPALADAIVDRATEASDATRKGSAFFKQSNVETYVTPYETSQPPEADLIPQQFEDEINRSRVGTGQDSRVLRATEDSYEVRPNVEIDPDGGLLETADKAIRNANKTVGGYFSSTGRGTCTSPSFDVPEPLEQFCETKRQPIERSCTLERQVWFDRFDTYRCDQRSAEFVRLCDKTISYRCEGEGEGCFESGRIAITGPGISTQWDGNTAIVRLPNLIGTETGIFTICRDTERGDRSCRSVTRDVTTRRNIDIDILLSDRTRLYSASLDRVRTTGLGTAVQVRKRGGPPLLGFYRNEDFGSKDIDRWARATDGAYFGGSVQVGVQVDGRIYQFSTLNSATFDRALFQGLSISEAHDRANPDTERFALIPLRFSFFFVREVDVELRFTFSGECCRALARREEVTCEEL